MQLERQVFNVSHALYVIIPAEIRKELKIEKGQTLFFDMTNYNGDECIRIMIEKNNQSMQLQRKVQKICASTLISIPYPIYSKFNIDAEDTLYFDIVYGNSKWIRIMIEKDGE